MIGAISSTSSEPEKEEKLFCRSSWTVLFFFCFLIFRLDFFSFDEVTFQIFQSVNFPDGNQFPICWIITGDFFRKVLSSAFSVLRFLNFEGQTMFQRVSLIVFLWNCPEFEQIKASATSITNFLNCYHPRASFSLESIGGIQIPTFKRSWLFGRLLLPYFVSAPLFLHIDADIWMVKPWLGPLVEDLSQRNQTDKLFFAGRDLGLMQGGNINITMDLGISPDTYFNAGFWVLRNVPEAKVLMNFAIQLLLKNPSLPWLEQTALNLAFGANRSGLLSHRFEKWVYDECKSWTINCHGHLPLIEKEANELLTKEFKKWDSR
jgi:hypothetical protein